MASIKELNIKISDLTKNQTESPLSNIEDFSSTFFSDVITKVADGVAYMKSLVVDTLKIGSPEKRTGITFYDEETGDPYCFSISNGNTKTILGECGIITPTKESGELTYTPENKDAPVITLDGDQLVSLDLGDTYTEAGALAKDKVDGELAVVISGSVDTTKEGTYEISYTTKNSAGVSTVVKRIVQVGNPVNNQNGSGTENGTGSGATENTSTTTPATSGTNEPSTPPETPTDTSAEPSTSA